MTATAEKSAPIHAEALNEVVRNLRSSMPSAQAVRINLLNDVYIDKATNIREDNSYTPEDINAMAAAIKAIGGLMNPLALVRIADSEETDHKPYTLFMGFRRSLGLLELIKEDPIWAENIPAIVVDEADTDAARIVLQFIENVSRKDLTHMEKAKALALVLADSTSKMQQKDLVAITGLKEETISNLLKLNKLPEELQRKVHEEKVSFSSVRDGILVPWVPESAWKESFDLAETLPYGEFIRKQERLYKRNKTEDATEDSSGNSESEGQKRTSTVRATDLDKTYLKFLKGQLEKADKSAVKFTEADLVQARIDTIKTVLLDPGTSLSKEIEPFVQEQAKAEEAEKANKEANDKREEYFKTLVKEVNKILEAPVDPTNPAAERPTLAKAYAAVVQRVLKLTDEETAKLGFSLDKDAAKLTTALTEAYVSDVKRRREDKEKREKAKAEKEAKEKADEAAKAAGGTPAAAGASS